MRQLRAGVAAAVLLGITATAIAADAQAPASRFGPMPASWQGIYSIIAPYIPEGANLVSEARRYGIEPLNPDHGAVATAHLQPWARGLMQANQTYTAIDDLAAVCGPAGIFRHPTTVAGYMLLQAPGQILLVSQDVDQVGVRRIYLRPAHPGNLLPTWNGDSIGHWEGSTLVVDTIGFNDRSWLGSELQPHTEALHVMERVHLVKEGRYLEIDTTVDDRKALTAPYSYSRFYRRVPQRFEQTASTCNADVGEQAEWVHFRDQAIEDFEHSRDDRLTAPAPAPASASGTAGAAASVPPAAARADQPAAWPMGASALRAPTPPVESPTSARPAGADLPGVDRALAVLDGVYEVVPDGQSVRGGTANRGAPSGIDATSAARVPPDRKASDLDPYGLCQPIGPFRMMAQPELRLQLVAAQDRLVLLFQDILHGYVRSAYLDRPHLRDYRARYAWQGDSVARWQGDTLIIDTIGFNDRTWLDAHTRANEALHLIERLRLVDQGRYLAYDMTASDPGALRSSYTYTRYFHRVARRIEQQICTPHTTWTLEDGF